MTSLQIYFIYLDHDTRPRRLEIGSYRSEDIRELHRPTTVTELNSFFGLYIVLRRFIQNLVRVAVHLDKTIRKPTIKIWTAESRRDREYESHSKWPYYAAGSSRTAPYRKYTLDTDASNEQVCCEFLQEQKDGTNKPMGYWSRPPTDAQRAYNTSHCECYALARAVLLLRRYLKWIT